MKKLEDKFIKENFQKLLELGVPLLVLETKNGWNYFLEHGEFPNVYFDFKKLSTKNAEELILIIDAYMKFVNVSDTLKTLLINIHPSLEKKMNERK